MLREGRRAKAHDWLVNCEFRINEMTGRQRDHRGSFR